MKNGPKNTERMLQAEGLAGTTVKCPTRPSIKFFVVKTTQASDVTTLLVLLVILKFVLRTFRRTRLRSEMCINQESIFCCCCDSSTNSRTKSLGAVQPELRRKLTMPSPSPLNDTRSQRVSFVRVRKVQKRSACYPLQCHQSAFREFQLYQLLSRKFPEGRFHSFTFARKEHHETKSYIDE